MSIYTSYRISVFKESALENKELSEIISNIKSGAYQDLVKDIQLAKPEEQKNLKQELPLFKSCIDTENIPNGLAHFDIDVKDNPSKNFIKLKQDIINIPEVVYCFFSPRGGLKLAVKTDFKSIDAYDKQRFKTAYFKAKAHIEQHIEPIVFDDSLTSISQDCFVSHDFDAYLNLDAPLLKLNDDCVYVVPDYSRFGTGNGVTESQILELLSYIPNDLKYDERLPINYAVLYELGEAGIYLLMAQWSTENRSKLESDLRYQLNNVQFGNTGTLFKIARDNGYVAKEQPKDSDYIFPNLLTIDEADIKLKGAISNFFDNKVNTFLNISTGFGKTTLMLKLLKELPRGKRVLILVQSHSFSKELKEKYSDIKKESFGINKVTFKSISNPNKKISGMAHIEGKNRLCQNDKVLDKYKTAGLGIPNYECTGCTKYHVSGCQYIEQRNTADNIRVMTHDEYTNEKSAWARGNTFDGSFPKDGDWSPNYIISDENFLKRDDCVATLDSGFSSIRNIINDVLNGVSLETATTNNYDDLVLDADGAKNDKFPADGDIKLIKNHNKTKRELIIMNGLLSGDFNRLKIIQTEKSTTLHYFRMKEIHSRYSNVPALYLDATANKTVVKKLLPDVEYVDLKVKQSDDIQVYMASDFNVSKSWISKQENLNQVVEMLKNKASINSNIGFITYLNIEGIEENFDEWLSDKTGIKIYNHFGNVRGSDVFESVDELYIVGRQWLKLYEYENYARAVFDIDIDGSMGKYPQNDIDTPIRMQDGLCMTINNIKFDQNELELVKNHFGDSENPQSIGRGRLIHGKAKKVFYLSNESLGADVAISGFVSKKDMFNFTIFDEQIDKARIQGYCKNTPKELMKLGFTKHHIDNNKEQIRSEFKSASFGIGKGQFKTKDRKKHNWEFYILDGDKMQAHLASTGTTAM